MENSITNPFMPSFSFLPRAQADINCLWALGTSCRVVVEAWELEQQVLALYVHVYTKMCSLKLYGIGSEMYLWSSPQVHFYWLLLQMPAIPVLLVFLVKGMLWNYFYPYGSRCAQKYVDKYIFVSFLSPLTNWWIFQLPLMFSYLIHPPWLVDESSSSLWCLAILFTPLD